MIEYEKFYHRGKLEDTVQEQGCKVWIIVATVNKHPYGAIFAFQHSANPYDIMIQGISKFIVPGVFSILKPDLANMLPRLNSLLMPAVETLALNAGASRIVVIPVGKQGDILVKHYGFHKIDEVDLPCKVIFQPLSRDYFAKNLDVVGETSTPLTRPIQTNDIVVVSLPNHDLTSYIIRAINDNGIYISSSVDSDDLSLIISDQKGGWKIFGTADEYAINFFPN